MGKNQNHQNQKPISVLVFGFWSVFEVDIFRIMAVLVSSVEKKIKFDGKPQHHTIFIYKADT